MTQPALPARFKTLKVKPDNPESVKSGWLALCGVRTCSGVVGAKFKCEEPVKEFFFTVPSNFELRKGEWKLTRRHGSRLAQNKNEARIEKETGVDSVAGQLEMIRSNAPGWEASPQRIAELEEKLSQKTALIQRIKKVAEPLSPIFLRENDTPIILVCPKCGRRVKIESLAGNMPA